MTDYTYRLLNKGEIIQDGDECEASSGWNAAANWIPVRESIGTPAPDPQYPAHRLIRRRVLAVAVPPATARVSE